MKCQCYTFLLLLSSVGVHAQQSFSLSDCINYSLSKHVTLQIEENNLLIAKEKGKQAFAAYLPQINSSATFVDNIKLQTTVIPAGIVSPAEVEVPLGTQFNTNAAIDFTQTIFDKSKIAGIKANKPYQQLTELQKQQSKENIAYNAAVAYFQVLILQEQQKTLQNNKVEYEAALKTLGSQVKLGVVLQKDYDRVLVSLNSTNYQIGDGVAKETVAINTLKNAIGMPFNEPLTIKAEENFEAYAIPNLSSDYDPANSLELKMQDQQIKLQSMDVKAKIGSFLPVLTAFGKYGSQSLNNDFSKAFSSWAGYSYVGVSANFPLFSGLKRKSVAAEAKLNLENDIKNHQITKDNLTLRYQNSEVSLRTAYSSYKSSKENMELAKKLFDVTNYQYQKGMASFTDFMNDDNAYKNAQNNYLNSLFNLMLSKLNYEKSKGSLLSYLNDLK